MKKLILTLFTVLSLFSYSQSKSLINHNSIENNNMNLYLSLYLSNYVPKKYLNSQYFYIVRELDNSRVAAKILNENEKIIIRPLTPSVSHYKYTLVISSKIKNLADKLILKNVDLRISFQIENGYVIIDDSGNTSVILKILKTIK